ncbi:MAG: group 1 truncated hemoglobin [Nocardia sp.]|nr:group 1 truncated hemoglobin [Nocardia sp.]
MPVLPAASGNPEPSKASSIYERVGGHEAIRTVVEELYARVLADEALSPFFTGTNMTRMKGLQVEYFSAVLGGPHPYVGVPMRQVHRGRGITRFHFDRVAGHLADALCAAGVPDPLLAQILTEVSPLADDISSGP